MRKISTWLILAFYLLCPNPVLSDSWEQFQKFNDGYYFLDEQVFEKFSCTVILPTVEAMIKDIQKQISSQGQMHLIRENLSDFRLTFRASGELTFFKPTLSVETDVTEESNKENLELGVKIIEDGFQTTIKGIVITLESLFSSYVRPSQELYRIESFKRDGGKVNIRYEFSGILLDVSCSGNQCTKRASTNNAEIEITESYISVGGKRALKDYRGLIKQPQQSMESTLAISYYEVGKLYVPREIKGGSTVTHTTGTANSSSHIILEDCRVE